MYTRSLRLSVVVALGVAGLLVSLAALVALADSDEHRFYLPLLTVSTTRANVCEPWVPVNDPAFGLGTGEDDDYSSEEGFEVVVFDEQLYVGMEADNSLGARIWRTKAGVGVPQQQDDWEEVAAYENGDPFGVTTTAQVDHIDSLASFGGMLYASTANRSGTVSGTLVFRSASGDAGTWQQVNVAGFGNASNGNFKDMRTFSVNGTEWLCGGTWNSDDGAEVWCTDDGEHWQQKNVSGFGDPDNELIASTGVFDGDLYVGVRNDTDMGSVWRTSDLTTWTKVYTSPDRPRIEVMGVLSGSLYVAAGAADGRRMDDPTIRVLRSSTGDAGSWTEAGVRLSDDPNNTRTIVDGAAQYNEALYVAVMNAATGVEVWETDGVAWTHVTRGNEGFGDAGTFAAQLIPFNGHLYAWTSNYAAGQRVMRTKCPIRETIEVTQTDQH